MKSILLAPVLALSLASWSTANTVEDVFARVEVQSGQAQVLSAGSNAQSIRSGNSINLSGLAHLEVPAGSEVRVTYPGKASLRLWGPASLDWQPIQDKGQQGIQNISWNLYKATWCDLEVRRGTHQMHLPGNWQAKIDGGSLRLRGLANGTLEMRLNAGRPVQVTWNGDVSQARPPLTIYPGSNIRLEQPKSVKTDQSGHAAGWDKPEWPYRRSAETQQEQKERSERPEIAPEPKAWPLPPVKAQIQPEEVKKGAASDMDSIPGLGETQAQVPIQPEFTQVRVETEKKRTPKTKKDKPAPIIKVPYESKVWRGVAKRDLTDCGAFVVEKGKGVEVRVFAGGRTKILVDRWEAKNTWILGTQKDYQLAPGAVVVFDKDGKLVMSHGTVDPFPATKSRPAFSEVK